jgi:signal transduction histidine kinase
MSLVAIWTHPVVCLLTGGEAATLWAVRPEPDIPQALLITRAVALTAVLLAQIILLERFFGFLAVALSRVRGESEMRKEALNELAFQIDERTRLEREVTRIGDEERRRLGQDVHDGVCQQLTAARLRCQVLQRKLEKKENLRPEELGALGGVLEDAIDEAHAVAKGLCPLQDTPSALADALRALVRRTQESTPMHCCFTLTGDVEVAEPSVAEQLYRIAQEALANAVRHSEANHVEVELASDHDELHLRIEDNGKGLPPDVRTHDGLGLRTMPHRAQTINATLTITPGAAGGTRITCRVPQSGAMEAWNE